MYPSQRIACFVVFLFAVKGFASVAGAASSSERDPDARFYFIDPTHSSVEFSVPFMGIARVSGRFEQFFGRVEHNEKNLRLSRADIVIRAASLDTRNARRDEDLRSEDYFDVSAFPEMVFGGTSVEFRDEQPFLVGDLTMRGVKRPLEIPFSIVGSRDGADGKEMGIEAEVVLDRRDFGLSHGQFSGDQVFIGNEVTVELFLRLREPSEAKRQMMEVPTVELEPANQERFAGDYLASEEDGGWRLEVLRLAEGLALLRGETLHRLVPVQANRFRLDDFAAWIRFESVDARVETLVFEREGREPVRYSRVD